ncbi:hypothetical protein [Flavobacterium rivuli]|uniref:hypothetical protein n=1 Tax=Flavobacterium rivuli TaxID=498301 RepID=UPI000373881C|nr:hypothetical protein [Flavobacterium rivuli]
MKHLSLFIVLFVTSLCFSQQSNSVKDEYRNKGYFNITRFSYILVDNTKQDIFTPGVGNSSNDLPTNNAKAFSIQTISGYFFSPYFSAGVGIGLDGYKDPNINTFPAFVEVRAYLKDSYNSPFAFIDYGGLIKISDSFNKGNMFNIGAGYKVFVSDRIALIPEISYSVKNISLTDEKVKTSDNTVNITGIQFGIGIIF